MKRVICGLISLVVAFAIAAFPSLLSAGAVDNMFLSEEDYSVEKKTICKASINEDFVPDEIIVKFSNSKSKELKDFSINDFSDVSAISVENLTKYSTEKLKIQRKNANTVYKKIDDTDNCYIEENSFHQCWLIKLDKSDKKNVLDCIKLLEQRKDIISVSPNYYYKQDNIDITTMSTADEISSTFDEKDSVPNDYTSSEQWAISKISLDDAWDITTGSTSVRVGILDTGINGNHPDLKDNIINADMSLHKNFVNSEDPLTDPDGHGTLMAGIIGAKGNNGIGITGVCWNVSLISLRIAYYNSAKQDYCSDVGKVCLAIDYAKVNNIKILNYSYSGTDPYSDYQTTLNDYDGLFVCSAGNVGTNISLAANYRYPAYYNTDNMICVANSTEEDLLNTETGFASCYSTTYVDLAAPGTDIYSTYENSYETFTGTSLATPYVTGVAALLKSKYPEMNTQAIKYYILGGVDKKTALSGKVSTGGRLNAYKALNNVTTFTVVYNPNGGGGSSMANTKVIYYNRTPLSKNTYTKDGFTFEGWYAQRASDSKWYYSNRTNSGWYLEGSQPAGYTKYLYVDKRTVINTTAVDGDIVTMYAQWNPDYIIRFDPNHGTGSMLDMEINYGETKQLRLNTFEALREDECCFHHWYAKRKNSENVDEIYYTNGSNSGWFTVANRPSGYTRVDIANGITINDNTFKGVCNGDIITLYAYWQPRVGILGDANQDGNINTHDVTLIQKHISHQEEIDPGVNQWVLCDVNFDGNITVADATLIQKFIARIIDEFGA